MNQKHEQYIYHASLNACLMFENIIQIRSGITISVGVSIKIKKVSCIGKRLHLESKYLYLWKWWIFSKCYSQISNYLWWNCKNLFIKNCFSKFQLKKVACKMKNFHILLVFLLITLALLIARGIYIFIKYWPKQKHSHITMLMLN